MHLDERALDDAAVPPRTAMEVVTPQARARLTRECERIREATGLLEPQGSLGGLVPHLLLAAEETRR